jgi:crotonobetainyl-CoA:carnitine CoA-transferase CaiB-like acyl-CoA transferase
MKPLDNIRVLSLAINLPGPLAVARLHKFGATVVKVEPPEGDPLAAARPEWYRELHEGLEVHRLDLKVTQNRLALEQWLAKSDLLITASRPAALQRLGLPWLEIHARWPHLCQVAIVGYPAPDEDRPGHDLTYQARAGLLNPPHLPRAMVADLGGAQEVVTAALTLILARDRAQGCHCLQVSLAEAAERFAEPFGHGLTTPGGILAGGFPGYDLYRARDGWIALAALEPHFCDKLAAELHLKALAREELEGIFLTRAASEWEAWAVARDLPLVAVSEAQPTQTSIKARQ